MNLLLLKAVLSYDMLCMNSCCERCQKNGTNHACVCKWTNEEQNWVGHALKWLGSIKRLDVRHGVCMYWNGWQIWWRCGQGQQPGSTSKLTRNCHQAAAAATGLATVFQISEECWGPAMGRTISSDLGPHLVLLWYTTYSNTWSLKVFHTLGDA